MSPLDTLANEVTTARGSELESTLKDRVIDALQPEHRPRGLSGQSSDPTEHIARVIAQATPLLSQDDRAELTRTLTSDTIGFGVIDRFLSDTTVTDIMINGPGDVWIERAGRLIRTEEQIDSPMIYRCIERLVAPLGLRADRSNPIVDARLRDGSRVNIVLPPLAPTGPLLTIRRHPRLPLALSSFMDSQLLSVVERILAARMNVVIYGPTGAGKTSLLASMVDRIPPDQRIVIVEDTLEIAVGATHAVRLEARPSGASGVGGASIRDLVRVSLRLRPDRLIVGEVRGAEALDMIWAMSTGHRGSISTCHANNAADVLRRLETMMLLGEAKLSVESVRDQIRSAVDVLIGMSQTGASQRVITDIHLLGANGRLRALAPRASHDASGADCRSSERRQP